MKENYTFTTDVVSKGGELGTDYSAYSDYPDDPLSIDKLLIVHLNENQKYSVTISIVKI